MDIERNRRNAQLSTGPRSAQGKSIARRNSLRHGLRANPAADVVENPRAFRRLLSRLTDELRPGGVLEEQMVHRIAMCLWRLQRSAKADAAVSSLAISSIAPERAEIQAWIQRINDAWRSDTLQGNHPILRQFGISVGDQPADRGRLYPVRLALRSLDAQREREMMQSGAAISAMMLMIPDLVERLKYTREMFLPMEAEKLAWLLGASAASFPVIDPMARVEESVAAPSPILQLIQEARGGAPGEELSIPLRALIENRLATLRQQRTCCEYPQTEERGDEKRMAALLPESEMLDRIVRYETNAQRGLLRALDALAKQRGVRVQSLLAVVAAVNGAPVALPTSSAQQMTLFAERTQ